MIKTVIMGTGRMGSRIRTTADLVNAFRRERLANQVLMQIVRDGRPYYARVLLQ